MFNIYIQWIILSKRKAKLLNSIDVCTCVAIRSIGVSTHFTRYFNRHHTFNEFIIRVFTSIFNDKYFNYKIWITNLVMDWTEGVLTPEAPLQIYTKNDNLILRTPQVCVQHEMWM